MVKLKLYMKSTVKKSFISRRATLKILGISSAALFTGTLGDITTATPSKTKKSRSLYVPDVRSRVSFTTGTDRVRMISEVMKPFEQQIRKGLKGKQLIIKPNMVLTYVPLCATHVDALRGVLEFVKPFYHEQIIIAEASGDKGNSAPGFKNYGYLDLQKEYDLRFIDLNLSTGSPVWILNRNLHPEKIFVTDMFLDPHNYIISVSRLKTHNSVVMTAGTKNIVMAAPLNIPAVNGNQQINYKSKMHGGGPRWLNYNMALLAQSIRPDFTVIDGVEGMEGNGPSAGTAVDHRIALAGKDVLAVDSICAKLMNIPVENIGYLNFCAAQGLGNIDYKSIDILGDKDPENFVRTYALAPNIKRQLEWKEDFIPVK